MHKTVHIQHCSLCDCSTTISLLNSSLLTMYTLTVALTIILYCTMLQYIKRHLLMQNGPFPGGQSAHAQSQWRHTCHVFWWRLHGEASDTWLRTIANLFEKASARRGLRDHLPLRDWWLRRLRATSLDFSNSHQRHFSYTEKVHLSRVSVIWTWEDSRPISNRIRSTIPCWYPITE